MVLFALKAKSLNRAPVCQHFAQVCQINITNKILVKFYPIFVRTILSIQRVQCHRLVLAIRSDQKIIAVLTCSSYASLEPDQIFYCIKVWETNFRLCVLIWDEISHVVHSMWYFCFSGHPIAVPTFSITI
jgi:hypothetical protein